MANNGMITVNGTRIRTPSEMTWGFQRVSSKDAGRTQDAVMHVNQVSTKRTLKMTWNGIDQDEAHALATAFLPEYLNVTYWDLIAGANVTKRFYTGDWSAPYKTWSVNNKMFSSLSFDLIEV